MDGLRCAHSVERLVDYPSGDLPGGEACGGVQIASGGGVLDRHAMSAAQS